MILLHILFGAWKPSSIAKSTQYRVSGSANKSKAPIIFAKTKIVSVLTNEWKTNKQIAEETGLQLNTVQQKTAKLHTSGKIDKTTRKEKSDIKPVCLYRLNQ